MIHVCKRNVFAFPLELEFSDSLSRQRVFRDRLNPINIYTDFIARYRITRGSSHPYPIEQGSIIAADVHPLTQ